MLEVLGGNESFHQELGSEPCESQRTSQLRYIQVKGTVAAFNAEGTA